MEKSVHLNKLYWFFKLKITLNSEHLVKYRLLSTMSKHVDDQAFHPSKALILSKFSRYEYEKKKYPECSEQELSKKVRKRKNISTTDS